MQISDNLYLDVEIEDLGIKNFLKAEDLYDFQMIETAGTSLPIIYLAFLTTEQDIVNYFIRNNVVKVKIGEKEEDADIFTVSIYSSSPPNNDSEGTKRLIEFSGFVKPQEYMVNFETKTYWGNSLLVTQRLLYDFFGSKLGNGFKTNITKTNENQVRWMQMNQTPCLFLAETLIHMDIMPSFPLFTFDKYGTFHLYDYNTIAKGTPVVNFVTKDPSKTSEIKYVNNFTVEDFKESYNLYSGYNKITEIWGANSGIVQYAKSYNEPVLASTKETDMIQNSSRISTNTVQSANVHNTYVEAFVYNSNKLVALSSMQGVVQLVGKYYKTLKPTDLVTVSTGGDDVSLDGLYLIDTIRTQVDMKRGGIIHTYVYVTRDNKNNVENYVANPQKGLKIKKQFLTDLLNALSHLRVAYAMGQQFIDGRYMKKLLSFCIETKRNLLRSFNVAGVKIDFNSSALLVQSLTNTGNSLMNTLTSMIFPEQIAGTLKDYVIRKPSMQALVDKYIAQYVPYELQTILSIISDSLFKTTNSLNSIARDNGISVSVSRGIPIERETMEETTTVESQEKIKNIITDFENNTTGLDIPFPIIDLTESQSLMPDNELKNYVANQTIANLTNLGYLYPEDIEQFKKILLGEEEIDFQMIDKINKRVGENFNYRFWGTYNDLTELTEFSIKKGYKDKFRTIPCTKLINATRNAKIYFACPVNEEDLRFYINSKRIEVVEDLDQKEEYENKSVIGYFKIDLGYVDLLGNPILYNVYYTNLGYNSTGVLFEVKQGGMV